MRPPASSGSACAQHGRDAGRRGHGIVVVRPGTRRAVLRRSGGRCEYCRTVGWPLTIDHVDPTRRGADADHADNLAAACYPCNRLKWHRTAADDPATGQAVRLFNPRTDDWEEHFTWGRGYLTILGWTATGRATVRQLKLNREDRKRQRRLLRGAAEAGVVSWP